MMASANCFLYLPKHTRKFIDHYGVENVFRSCTLRYGDEHSVVNTSSVMRNLILWPNAIHISFLRRNIAMQMENIAAANSVGIINIDRNTCKLNHPAYEDISVCGSNYLNALLYLFKMAHVRKTAIISSVRGCRKEFAEKLCKKVKSLPHSDHDHQENDDNTINREFTFHRISESNTINNISNTLVDLKTKDVTLIILLADHQTMQLIFQIGKQLGVTTHSFFWITIGLSNYDHGHTPFYVMDLRVENNLTWEEKALKMTMSRAAGNLTELFEEHQADSTNRSIFTSIRNQVRSNLREMPCANKNDVQMFFKESKNASEKWTSSCLFTDGGHSLVKHTNVIEFFSKLKLPVNHLKLKVVTIIDAPFTMLADYLYRVDEEKKCEHGILCSYSSSHFFTSDTVLNETCCIGMVMDILAHIATDLNFHPVVYIVKDGFYGGKNETSGRWNGLIWDIYSRKADVAVGALTPTPERLKYVDFCEPFMEAHIGIMISTMRYTLTWLNMEFLKPLEIDLRIAIVGTFIIGTILIYILENQRLALLRIIEPSAYPTYSWREGFTYFVGLAFQRDLGGKNPQRFGARVTAISFAFAMVIIMTTYTAVLTASKVSKESFNPFFGFKDKRILFPSNDYKFATVSYTGVESYFGKSEKEDHRRIYSFMHQYNVKQTSEGINELKEGNLQAFIYGYPFLAYHLSKQNECNLKIAESSKMHLGYAFSVPQNSSWKSILTNSIIKLKENEVIQQLYEKWSFSTNCSTQNSGSTGYAKMEIKYFGGLIFILVVFICICFSLFGLEHLWHCHHRRIINPIQSKVQNWRDTRAAGRRDAFIDPQDIQKIKKLRKRNFLRRKITQRSVNRSSNEGSVISEAEDQLIRMRLQRNKFSRMDTVLIHEDSLASFDMVDDIRRASCVSVTSDSTQMHSSAYLTAGRLSLKRTKSDGNIPDIDHVLKELSKRLSTSSINELHPTSFKEDCLSLCEVWKLFESNGILSKSNSIEGCNDSSNPESVTCSDGRDNSSPDVSQEIEDGDNPSIENEAAVEIVIDGERRN